MDSYEPAWLDRMYNNRARVPDHPTYLGRWATDSAAARASLACQLDVPYGEGPGETLDIFPASAPDAPVLVFIHGGYWSALDKSDHSFIARAFTDRGVCVVIPNYALCPGTPAQPIGIGDISQQMVRALAWTWRNIAAHGGDPARITVSGHSAGGHLSAMLFACGWKAVAPDLPADLVRNALSISGLHDLRPLQRAPFIEKAIRLGDSDALRLSPALGPVPSRGTFYAVAGGDESEEFIRQNALIQDAWGRDVVAVCEVLPGLHHFSIVDTLASPGQRLHGLAMQLLQA